MVTWPPGFTRVYPSVVELCVHVVYCRSPASQCPQRAELQPDIAAGDALRLAQSNIRVRPDPTHLRVSDHTCCRSLDHNAIDLQIDGVFTEVFYFCHKLQTMYACDAMDRFLSDASSAEC